MVQGCAPHKMQSLLDCQGHAAAQGLVCNAQQQSIHLFQTAKHSTAGLSSDPRVLLSVNLTCNASYADPLSRNTLRGKHHRQLAPSTHPTLLIYPAPSKIASVGAAVASTALWMGFGRLVLLPMRARGSGTQANRKPEFRCKILILTALDSAR